MPLKPTAKKDNKNPVLSPPASKTEKPAQTLVELLAETERTIRELTVLFAQQPGSSHLGVGGTEKLTQKQQEIKDQLDAAKQRYDKILSLLTSRE
jgi:hypothetical protein